MTSMTAQYKKSWLVSTRIARDLLSCQVGDRLPTIQEFTQRLKSSRGIVQNALKLMQEQGAIQLDIKGKSGSFLTQMDRAKLFELADLHYITGSMAAPLAINFAGLATGICSAMDSCPTNFNFSFMHSSENRAKALSRMVYDFVVVSLHSAKQLEQKYPDLQMALVLAGSIYSSPLVLVSSRPEATELTDGSTIAADPHSNDQYTITQALCQGKDVRIVHAPYISTSALLAAGEVDFVVRRRTELPEGAPYIPLPIPQKEDMTLPVLLVNRHNYGIDRILRQYLAPSHIAETQAQVMAGRREPEFY